MNETVRRGARTLMQVSVAAAVLKLLIAFHVPITAEQEAAIMGVLTVLVTVLHNGAEAATGMSVLKGPPGPPA